MQAQVSAAVLGLLTTGCDALLTRQREVEYVWKRPFQLSLVRCLFILARYLALLIHIAFIALSSVMTAKYSHIQHIPEDICMSSQIFQTISCYSMLLLLQLILMLRVFALYERSLWISVFLLILLIGRLLWSAVVILYTFGNFADRNLKFSGPCVPHVVLDERPMRSPVVIFISGELFVQIFLHGLAWKRTIWDLRRFSFSRPALISVLNRDSLKVFIGIVVAMIAISVAAVKRGIPALFIFPQFISLISILGTRTILNLQTLYSETDEAAPSSEKSQGIEFTTIHESAVWDAATFLNADCYD
ncbi:hypothetical protein GYMLUDRAFT_861995 [Collybiopsis luxurians FD-317 M1]|nr:hypothetical protein GYMLUDRAFT_861995 [Collybiopsis luxurians FD-317 M1]